MTSTSTSVPPHTLAWIYNPTSNETIIYVNPTDRSLDIGDPGLLEIHLQGVVSVAESDFVYEPEAAAVAAALEGIDPALLVATASDGTVLTTGSAHASIEAEASESTLGTAGMWTMPADDGLRFHFGRDRIGSIVSSRLTSFSDDSAYATEESDDDAVTVPVHVSSIELSDTPVIARATATRSRFALGLCKCISGLELTDRASHRARQLAAPFNSASASAAGVAEPSKLATHPVIARDTATRRRQRPTGRQNRASLRSRPLAPIALCVGKCHGDGRARRN